MGQIWRGLLGERACFCTICIDTFGGLEEEVVELLDRVQKVYCSQVVGSSLGGFIFRRISCVILRGVGAQIVARIHCNIV